MIRNILIITAIFFLSSCKDKVEHSASGVFEATEVIVSAEADGKVQKLNVTEGDWLTKEQCVGYIDSTQLYLKKLQLQTSKEAVKAGKPDLNIQIAATKEQIAKAEYEKRRVENLLKDNAATQKQLDDIESQLKVLKNSLAAQINSLSNSINTINEQSSAYEIQVAQIEDMLSKCKIINPIEGRVLSKYTEEKEIVGMGKPLYKIADTKHLFLRAYLVSSQLESVKIGQEVTVYINAGEEQKTYQGKVTWISDKAEFTPKTIQTKDERQNLVYAIKIAVENTDGLIKIGMYGDIDL